MAKGSTKKLLKSKKFQEYHNQSKRKLAVLVQMEKIRQELGLTQKELANKMELDQSDISNMSRIAYYFAVQNLIFYTLQTALFAAIFDDDEDDKKLNKKKYVLFYIKEVLI